MKEEKIIWEKNGSEMMLIPAGSFEMGDHFDEGDDDELPIHEVELDAFYMDAYQVSVGRFKQFVEDSGHDYQGNWDDVAQYSPGDEYSMIYVDWNDATAYAKWAGKRLPTEAEWEYAARGGLRGKRYPWGDDESLARDYANYEGTGGKDKWSQSTAPVGSFEANGYGLYDMAGNIWEWSADRYDEYYCSRSPTENPPGPGSGSSRALRGGSWYNNTIALRVATRNYTSPTGRNPLNGFRCCVSGLR